MDLAELSRQVAREARQLQANVERFHFPTDSNSSTESIRSIESALSRIEERLTKVHGHTGELVNRIPENLSLLLAELKESVLERIDLLKERSTESTGSVGSAHSKGDWRVELFGKLTPREQSLFRACFGSGLITYKELAERLDIAPVTAKNIVNRLFQNADKCKLFRKAHTRGVARIGVAEAVEQKVLHRDEKGSRKNKKNVFVFED